MINNEKKTIKKAVFQRLPLFCFQVKTLLKCELAMAAEPIGNRMAVVQNTGSRNGNKYFQISEFDCNGKAVR